ncbi:MAG: NADH-quinone oxidoreductase subunit C [Deltaproteobacteria bacterium]|nr:NADH-quinone oxidoreductase subunit C [Deltaproteobacteria bacterium]MCB9786404.1 NADH-quinone oxidoreductase subunit C [Deltaproteobacteria bacterium]
MSQAVVQAIIARFPDAVVSSHDWRGDDTVVLRREHLLEVARFLKHDDAMQFNLPVDVCGVDYLGWREPRFEVVYHLMSLVKRHRVRLKVQLDEADLRVPSLTGVWKGVDWFEREAWDMYGIVFDGHPDLRRILTYEEFEGHALRKDYPQRGYQPLMPMPTLSSDLE